MTATRYTAQGRRDAEARRKVALELRRRWIASLTADAFLEEVVGYPTADACPEQLREDYLVEWQGCREEFPEEVPA